MSKKWMVYDTSSEDIVFHDTEEKALKDYNEALEGIESGELVGEHTVYLFEVKKEKTCVFYPED